MLNLGSIQFGLGVDTRGLDGALRAIESFGRTVQGVQTAANRGFETSINILRRQENVLLQGLERVASAQDRIARTVINPQVRTDALDRLAKAYQALQTRATSGAAGLDPTKIDRAQQSFNQLVNDILRGVSAEAALNAQAEKYANTVARATEQAANLGTRIQTAPQIGNLGPQFGAVRTQLTDQLERALQQFRTNMATATAETAGQFQRQWNAAIGNVRRQFQTLAAPVGIENWRRGLALLGDASILATGRLSGMAIQFFALGQLIKNHGVLLGTVAAATITAASTMVSLGNASLQAFIKMQQIQYGLTAITKSAVETNAEFSFLSRVATNAGLRIDEVAQSYNSFYVAAKTANLAVKDTHDVFQTVSQAAGVLHLQSQQVQLAFLALEQMLSKGTVQTEELRRQLGDQLPGAFQIAARAMGVNTAELAKMLKAHEIASNVFLPKFAKALRDAYGLDINQRIETLQASIARAHNSIFLFFNAFAVGTGLGKGAEAFVDSFSRAIDTLAAHLPQAIGLLGGLASAFAALGAISLASTTFTLLATGVAAFAANLGAAIVLIREAKTATEALTVAQMLLNTVFSRSLLGTLAKIAIAIGVGILGYKYFNDIVEKNMSAMNNVGPIQNQIKAQQQLGYQVRSTTEYMLEQLKVMREAAAAAQAVAMEQLHTIQQQGPNTLANLGATAAYNAQALAEGRQRLTPEQILAQRHKEAQQEALSAIKQRQAILKASVDAMNLTKLPELPSGPGVIDDTAKKVKGLEAATRQADEALRKLNGELEDADTAFRLVSQALDQGKKPNFDYIDALIANRNQLRSMSTLELKVFSEKLGMAGASIDKVAAAMTDMEMPAIRMQNAIKMLHEDLDNLDQATVQMRGLEKINSFLREGGDPNKVFIIEAMNKATERVVQYQQQGEEGVKNLNKLIQALRLLGFAGATATEVLDAFYLKQEQLARQRQALESIAAAWKDIAKEVVNAEQNLAAARTGNDKVQEYLKQLQQARDQVQQFAEQQQILVDTGAQTSAAADAATAAYAAQVAQMMLLNDQTQKQIELWSNLKDTWVDAFHSAYDNIIAVIQGTKSLGKAVEDVAMSIVNNLAQHALDTLANSLWNLVTAGGSPLGTALGIFTKGGGTGVAAANARAASSVTQLATAAGLAATALMRLAGLNGVPLGGSSGGGGILGSIISGIGSIAGSIFGGGFTPSVVNISQGSLFTPGPSFSSILSTMPSFGRAHGGPGSKGSMYLVGEQGTEGDIFIPGTQGFFAKPQGGSNHTFIDASTSIDARGATADAIQELKLFVLQRDQQLRNELPFIIDNRTVDSSRRLRTRG